MMFMIVLYSTVVNPYACWVFGLDGGVELIRQHNPTEGNTLQELDIFSYDGRALRVAGTPEDPWFVAQDVCAVLDLAKTDRALSGLDEDEKGAHTVRTPGGEQRVTTVNEAGLYSLVLRSRKPQAHDFKRWLTHEVIPSIRKTGSYGPAAEILTLQQAVEIGARVGAQVVIEAMPALVKALQPEKVASAKIRLESSRARRSKGRPPVGLEHVRRMPGQGLDKLRCRAHGYKLDRVDEPRNGSGPYWHCPTSRRAASTGGCFTKSEKTLLNNFEDITLI